MKILLIDHHTLFREGLRQILQRLPGGTHEILEAENFTDGLNLARKHSDLNLVLLETKSPGCEGAASIKFFCQRYPHIPVVVISSETGRLITNKVLRSGASSFISKDSAVSALLETLSLVISGNIYVPPQFLQKTGIAAWCKNNLGDIRNSNADKYNLTTRQINILEYLSAGLSNKGIAQVTNLAEGTVKTHIAAIYQILRVNNRIEAMQVAKQLGLNGAPIPKVKSEPNKLPGYAGTNKKRRTDIMRRIQL